MVLGIDPGLTRCGYAVVVGTGADRAHRPSVARGASPRRPTRRCPQRLAELRGELAALIAEFRPDVVAVEHVFFQVNVRTAMSVGQASGLALAEAAAAGCEVVQYTPNQVKQAITGWGAADKDAGARTGAGPARAARARRARPMPPMPPRSPCATSRWPRCDDKRRRRAWTDVR